MLSGSGEIPYHVLLFLDMFSFPALLNGLLSTLPLPQSPGPQNLCVMTQIVVITY